MEVLLLDPQAAYADRFIQLIGHAHGLRVVALHTSWRTRILGSPSHPAGRSSTVVANYMIAGRSLDEVARMLRQRHRIVAVAPHHESTLLPLHGLAERLGLDWAQPDVVPMFRDKGRLKAHLRQADPDLRINAAQVVADGRAARAFVAETGAARIVLKPNDGAGNVDVAFFSADASEAELAGHIARVGRPVLAEEYVGGDEYYVNGQMDDRGRAHVISVNRYRRIPHLGKENVEVGGRTLKRTDPGFPALADYATRLMEATGLRRSPFHLEAKLDQRGPCLIEVAARLGGDEVAFLDGRMHGCDVLGLALANYLDPAAPPPVLDWVSHDRLFQGTAYGLAERGGLISTLRGVPQVEAMPEFVRWVERPHVGQRVRPTIDLLSTVWCAEFEAATSGQLERACERAAALVTWETSDGGLERLRGTTAYAAGKVPALIGAPGVARRTSLRWR